MCSIHKEVFMFLYLVQHAEAKKEEEDPMRPLSEKGLLDIGRVAAYISRLGIKIDAIFHSNKLRAKQTAEVLSSHLTPSGGIAEKDRLSPLDDPKTWAERLKEMTGSVMLTGHQPHLGKLASLLLCGDEDKNIVLFRMAGVVCLGRDDSGTWSLQWMLIPGVIA
jgi:phosphohistidine phosphatase